MKGMIAKVSYVRVCRNASLFRRGVEEPYGQRRARESLLCLYIPETSPGFNNGTNENYGS